MLGELMDVLEQKDITVSRRGTGAAEFLFVTSPGRAVEVSRDGDLFWLEFWTTSNEDSDDPPVKELTCESIEKAAAEIEDWLKGHP